MIVCAEPVLRAHQESATARLLAARPQIQSALLVALAQQDGLLQLRATRLRIQCADSVLLVTSQPSIAQLHAQRVQMLFASTVEPRVQLDSTFPHLARQPPMQCVHGAQVAQLASTKHKLVE